MKTPKANNKPVSKHSRAARRAEDTGLGIRSAPSPEPQDNNDKTAFRPDLAGRGVIKKTKKKQMTRQQRLRHQKGLERADMNVEKLEKKVKDSLSKAKVITNRAVTWDELNQDQPKSSAKKSATKYSALQQDDENEAGDDDEEEAANEQADPADVRALEAESEDEVL